MSIKGRTAIVGYGETPFTKKGATNIVELAVAASKLALEDCNLTPADIDGVISLGPLSTSARLNNIIASYLRIRPTFSTEASVYGASGGFALKLAAEAIVAGAAKRVLVVGADLNFMHNRSNEPHYLNDAYMRPFVDGGATTSYAMVTNLHEHLYGSTAIQRAKVAVDQRFNANAYENAIFKDKTLSIEEVLASPVLSEPIHLYEIVSPCDGAIAFIVTTAEDAKTITETPVYIDGAGFYNSHFLLSEAPMLQNGLETGIKQSSSIAFEMAGITPKEIDICGFYDCYTIAVLLTLEDMGFCKKGEGGHFIEEHDLTYKGDFPLNTSGGQLSVGQPGDAGGMVNIIEVVRQLMGRAGVRQVANLEYGATNSNGGFFSNQCTLILRKGG